jgi:FkbM family methyltransferase
VKSCAVAESNRVSIFDEEFENLFTPVCSNKFDKFDKFDKFWKDFNEKGCTFVIYARTVIGAFVASKSSNLSNCLGMWDINPKLNGLYCCGVQITTTPTIYSSEYENVYALVSTSVLVNDDIKKHLISIGFKAEHIIVLSDYLDFEANYSEEPLIKSRLIDEEIFIDGGVLDLESSFDFLKAVNNRGKAIAFEPEPRAYKLSEANLSSAGEYADKIQLVNAALWSESTVLYFEDAETKQGGSAVSDSGTLQVKGIALDDYLNGEPATFIKLDIEGSELSALRGMEKTIKKYKPKLAVCVYHRGDDYVDIPEYIHSIVPEYKFYLRHYSAYPLDTVLYCVL